MTDGNAEQSNKRIDPNSVGASIPRKKSGKGSAIMRNAWKGYKSKPREEWTAWQLVCHFHNMHQVEYQDWPRPVKWNNLLGFVSALQKTLDSGEFTVDEWCSMIEWAVRNWPDIMRRVPKFREVTLQQIYGARFTIRRSVQEGRVCDPTLKKFSERDLTTVNGENWAGMEVEGDDEIRLD